MIPADKLSHLTETQRRQYLAILDRYASCFSDTPGYCPIVEHEIVVTADFVPRRLKAYRVPEKLKPEVDKQIQELLRLGYIHESTSPQASPLVCVIKKDSTVRCVMDYRYVNKYTVSDALGPPDMLDVMHRIGRATYISTFDGKSSYHTIPVKQEHQWLTAFIYDTTLYEWSRVPFGMRNSGCSFIRAIKKILHKIRDYSDSYVDDLAVFSDDWKLHLKHVEEFLRTIKASGLTLALKKSEFAQPHVKFCGHIIGSGTRTIDPSKVDAIRGLKRPETKTQVRQVLGLFSWFRDYIPRFADVARPLTDLTSKKIPQRIPWGEAQERSFEELKSLLCQAASQPLYIIDWSRNFNIFTDSSDYCAAGVLSQTDAADRECPIAFYSKKYNDTQRAWSTIDKEAFACLEALRRFKHWIYGYRVHLYSDHNPLSYLTESVPKSAKLLRWALALQEFDIVFHYKAGKTSAMAVPDCLSRLVEI
jgi:hypothetical protein